MSCLCIGGVCIPYSTILPLILLGLQWIGAKLARVGLLPLWVGRKLGERSLSVFYGNDSGVCPLKKSAVAWVKIRIEICNFWIYSLCSCRCAWYNLHFFILTPFALLYSSGIWEQVSRQQGRLNQKQKQTHHAARVKVAAAPQPQKAPSLSQPQTVKKKPTTTAFL